MHLLGLSDDILRHIVARIPSYEHRHSFALSCTRAADASRAETTLWVELHSGVWESQGVGLPAAPSVTDGRLTAPLHIDVRDDSLPHFSGRLRWALNILLLAHRRSAAQVGLHSLRLIERQDLERVIPGLAFHLAMASTLGLSLIHI